MNSLRTIPYIVETRNLKFIISGKPEKYSVDSFVEVLIKNNAKKLIRVSEDTYDLKALNDKGIIVEELLFRDGSFPEESVVDSWIDIVFQYFLDNCGNALAIHDRAGLGRAPLLVAIAFVENGLKAQDALNLIRSKRRGCLNFYQEDELLNYKPKYRLKKMCKSQHFFFSFVCLGK